MDSVSYVRCQRCAVCSVQCAVCSGQFKILDTMQCIVFTFSVHTGYIEYIQCVLYTCSM